MSQYPGKFFDGKTSTPLEVFLEPEFEALIVKNHVGSILHRYPYEIFTEVEKLPDGFKLEETCKDPSQAGISILFSEKDLWKQIIRYREKDISKSKSFFEAFYRIPLAKAFAWLILAILLIGTILTLFIFNLHKWIPEKYDIYLGNKVSERIISSFDTCKNDSVLSVLNQMAQDLSRPSDPFTIEVIVLNENHENAFALPGGKVLVFRKLLENSQSPEEVAGVLAHEIAHVQNRHGLQQLNRTMGFALMTSFFIGLVFDGAELFDNAEIVSELATAMLFLKYSRNFERQADQEAISRLHENQISVSGLKNFLSRVHKQEKIRNRLGRPSEWISTHPLTESRIHRMEEMALHEDSEKQSSTLIDIKRWIQIKGGCK